MQNKNLTKFLELSQKLLNEQIYTITTDFQAYPIGLPLKAKKMVRNRTYRHFIHLTEILRHYNALSENDKMAINATYDTIKQQKKDFNKEIVNGCKSVKKNPPKR